MVQFTVPLASVVPLQDWAVVPDPMVKVTTLVGRGDPDVGVSVVRVPESVVGEPLTADVGPVYVTSLESGVTVNVLVEESEPMGADVVVSPENDAVSVYELEGSPGGDDTRGGPGGIGGGGAGLRTVQGEGDGLVGDGGCRSMSPSTRPRPEWGRRSCRRTAGWRVLLGVADTTVGDAATSIWSSTERPKSVPEWVLICCSTSPEAISTFQMSPEVESPVQKELPVWVETHRRTGIPGIRAATAQV